jgi:hypothetical protein
MMRAWIVLVFVTACSKPSGTGPAPSASAVASAGSSAAASAMPSATSSAAPSARATYEGTYALTPGSYYVPEHKDYAGVKQAKDDPSKHVGNGTLALSIEGERVTGTIDTGPASPAVIDGSIVDGEIRATVRRKTPDDGLTGTLTAHEKDGTGALSLAESNAAIVREGKLSLQKK